MTFTMSLRIGVKKALLSQVEIFHSDDEEDVE